MAEEAVSEMRTPEAMKPAQQRGRRRVAERTAAVNREGGGESVRAPVQ